MFEKSVAVFAFIRLPSSFFVFCVGHNWSDNQEFKTTRVEDIKLRLGVISLQVEVNNSSFFFGVTNIREKNCQVSVPVRAIIPWIVD